MALAGCSLKAARYTLGSTVLSAGLGVKRSWWQLASVNKFSEAASVVLLTESAYANPTFSTIPNPNKPTVERSAVGEYRRLMPCPPQNFLPRIEHILVEKGGNVVEIVSDSLALPNIYVEDLIRFGAVHTSLVCPVPPESASPEQIELYDKYITPDFLEERSSVKGKTLQEARKVFRVLSGDEELEVGSYLRVHVHPKRFPRCYEVDWRSRVLLETESYVILDKPAGVSVGGTVDNLEESCATFAARAMGLEKPLILTHQIDACTEGCVVLAKTNEFSSKFHELLRDRKVRKLYCALTAAPVPLGRVTHFMCPGRKTPRLFSKHPVSDWAKCEMDVLKCKKVAWPKPSTEATYRVGHGGWEQRETAYEVTVRLLTGRTHQIRGQLAALGAPLVGDSMYMPAAVARLKSPALDPFLESRINFTMDSVAKENWVMTHGPEPECAIGLQASYISWGGNGCTSRTGAPWWKT